MKKKNGKSLDENAGDKINVLALENPAAEEVGKRLHLFR